MPRGSERYAQAALGSFFPPGPIQGAEGGGQRGAGEGGGGAVWDGAVGGYSCGRMRVSGAAAGRAALIYGPSRCKPAAYALVTANNRIEICGEEGNSSPCTHATMMMTVMMIYIIITYDYA